MPKYGNNTSMCKAGHSHRSKLESSVCAMLHLRMKAGEFSTIEAEQRIAVCGPLEHECSSAARVAYIVDFKCTGEAGNVVWAEAKGVETPEWRIKRRLWVHNNLGILEIWAGDYRRPYLKETIGK